MIRKHLHTLLYRRFPRVWFMLAYRVENEYQTYTYKKNELSPFGETLLKHNALVPVFAPLVQRSSFLELGCDAGYFVLWAAMAGAASAVGIDRNAEALAHAERAQAAIGVNGASFRRASIPHLEDMGAFETVMMLSTIHYMFSDKQGNQLLFSSMDSYAAFLSRTARRHVLVEFVEPSDPYAQELVSDALVRSQEYSSPSFCAAMQRYFPRLTPLGPTHRSTRSLWLASRDEPPDWT